MEEIGEELKGMVAEFKERFEANPVPLSLPIGSGDNFSGLVDLIRNEALIYTSEDGSTFEYSDIPVDPGTTMSDKSIFNL